LDTFPVALAGIAPLNVMVMVEPLGMIPVVRPVANAAAVFGEAGGHTADPVEVHDQVVPTKFVMVVSLMTAPVTEPDPEFVAVRVYGKASPGVKLVAARVFTILIRGEEIVKDALAELLVAEVSRSMLGVMLAVLFTVPDDSVGPTAPVIAYTTVAPAGRLVIV
jgi:hypothetical protein